MSDSNNWVKWKTSYDKDPYRDTSWLTVLKIRTFKILLIVGIIFLSVIVVRAFSAFFRIKRKRENLLARNAKNPQALLLAEPPLY